MKHGTHNEFASLKLLVADRRKDRAEEMEGYWIGPMPVEEFLEAHMGASNGLFSLRSPSHLHDVFQSTQAPGVQERESVRGSRRKFIYCSSAASW